MHTHSSTHSHGLSAKSRVLHSQTRPWLSLRRDSPPGLYLNPHPQGHELFGDAQAGIGQPERDLQFRAAPRLDETSRIGKWERAKPEMQPVSTKNKLTFGCSTKWMQSCEHLTRAPANHGALAIPRGHSIQPHGG